MISYRCGGPKLISSPSTGTGRPCMSSVIGRARRKDSIVISPAASDRRSMPRRSWSPRSPAPSCVLHSVSCQRCATPTILAPGSRSCARMIGLSFAPPALRQRRQTTCSRSAPSPTNAKASDHPTISSSAIDRRHEPRSNRCRRQPSAQIGSPESARRLFAMSQRISGTIAEAYLRNRGISALHDVATLRFHPRCYYRPDADAPTEVWPALIAAVTNLAGSITGAHRTWLDPTGEDKAPIDTPRRAMGRLLGHGVRFGVVTDVMAAGEGIETMLSVRSALPDLSMVAALSANHLAALLFRVTLRRLYVVRDDDTPGDFAVATLTQRAQAAGIEVLTLSPTLADFNEDLRHLGVDHLRAALRLQLAAQDVPRFLNSMDGPGSE